jgi:uncharacterized paraquat-inducible protein A
MLHNDIVLPNQTAVRRLIIIAILHIILSLSTHSDINIQRAELRIRYKKRHIIIEIGIKMHDALCLSLFYIQQQQQQFRVREYVKVHIGLYVVAFYEFMLKEISA